MPIATAQLNSFETERPRLVSLAYQMLGEIAAAEDVVQEAWIRWQDTDHSNIEIPAAWLTTVVTRLAIDQLRSARQRREVYTGTWLPEPILDSQAGPQGALELAQQCELALLWSLERLKADERAAFLLHQVFDVPHTEIANMLGRSESSCRQLVSRAKKHLADHQPRFQASDEQLEQAMMEFAVAASAGDKEGLMALLAPNVVALSDGGGVVTAALIPLEGPARVAQVFTHIATKGDAVDGIEIQKVNGRPALVRLQGDEGDMVLTLRLNAEGEICWIYTMRNPEKLPKL
jgi:RNA polymerase sigma-70 factor, ECF subfamily